MDEVLVEELNLEIGYLINSAFYKKDEILEIMEEQFIDEDIPLDCLCNLISVKYDEKIAIESKWSQITDFDRLKDCFVDLAQKNIIAIHNAGYSLNEGVQDSFQVFHYLNDKNLNPEGFCFYTFQDIEMALESKLLKITFGDFEDNKEKSLEIAKTIADVFKNKGFSLNLDDTNYTIEIDPFIWEKRFDDDEYEIEGAFSTFLKNK